MKKSILYVIIVVLVSVISSGVTYIVMDSKDNNVVNMNNKSENNDKEQESIKEEVLKDGVDLVDTYKENDKIIQEFKVVLNGKESIMKVEYEYLLSNELEPLILGKFNDITFYIKEYYEEEYNKESLFNVDNINSLLNENYFTLITGKDNKNYLGIFSSTYVSYFEVIELYIFNDNLEIINKNFNYYGTEASEEDDKNGMIVIGYTGFRIEPNKWVGYNEEIDSCFYSEGCYQLLKIENNKIYYLMPIFNLDGEEYGILEERVYTINNDKLEYVVKSRNKIIDISGQIP